MGPALLDTDTLSAVVKGRNRVAVARATGYAMDYGPYAFSAMTRFEIARGFRASRASTRLAAFEALCGRSHALPITDEVLDRAAGVHADLKPRGQLIGDADLIIAATALVHGLTLVTSNTAHFSRIAGLTLDCWVMP